MFLKNKQPVDKYKISINKAWSLSKMWKRIAITWRVLDHFFAIGSFACSIAVVYLGATSKAIDAMIIMLSSIAALLTLSGFACNPARYMSCYRLAYQVLNDALVSNTDENGNVLAGDLGFKKVRAAIKKGEIYIGKTYEVEIFNHNHNENENS